MILRLATLLCFAAGVGFACDCIKARAREAKRWSEVVFRGTVVAFRDSDNPHIIGRMVIFRVNRVWKGPVTKEFETVGWVGDSCEAYYPGVLKIGSELLVFAHRFPPYREYFPVACNTEPVRDAAKDIQELGPGNQPNAK